MAESTMRPPPDLVAELRRLADGWETDHAESIDGLAALCPHCGVFASFKQACSHDIRALVWAEGTNRLLFQLACSSCRRLALVASRYVGEGAHKQLELRLLWPVPTPPSRAPAALPAAPRQDYDEARAVLYASPKAAATLTRRCLQHVLRDKLRVKPSTLYNEIAEATDNPELSVPTRRTLDHIRSFGNFAAHPTLDAAMTVIDVKAEEAAYTLFVLERQFHDPYDAPELEAAMTASIETKENG